MVDMYLKCSIINVDVLRFGWLIIATGKFSPLHILLNSTFFQVDLHVYKYLVTGIA